MPFLKELLSHALGGNVPQSFLEHLVKHRDGWDETFTSKIDELAYELRPDLATWEINIDKKGRFTEKRLPLIEQLIDS